MEKKEEHVKKIIKKAYEKIATGNNSCCSCECTGVESQTANRKSKENRYSNDEINAIPEANLGLGSKVKLFQLVHFSSPYDSFGG